MSDAAKRREQRKRELEEKRRKLKQFKDQNSRLKQIDEQASPKAKNIVNPTPTATVNVDELLAEVAQVAPTPVVAAPTEAEQAASRQAVRRPLPAFSDSTPLRSELVPLQREVYSKGTQTDASLTAAAAPDAAVRASEALVHAAALQQQQQQQQQQQHDGAQHGDDAAADEANAREQCTVTWRVDTVSDDVDAAPAAVVDESHDASFRQFCASAVPASERAVRLNQRFEYLGALAGVDGDDVTGGAGRGDELTARGQLFDEQWCANRAVAAVDWSSALPDLLAVALSAPETAAGAGGGGGAVDGVVLVWSGANLLQRPEFVFTCASPVTAVAFANFQPTLLVGGTYSGQIVLWDTRAGSTPVQRALVSSLGHTHPVFSVALVGTANAHNIVTASTDGRMCVWSLSNLTEPSETLELSAALNGGSSGASNNNNNNSGASASTAGVATSTNDVVGAGDKPGDEFGTPMKGGAVAAVAGGTSTPLGTPGSASSSAQSGSVTPVACTVLRFGHAEVNSFLVGSEEGVVFQGYRHGARRGIDVRYAAHSGPITGLALHPHAPADAASSVASSVFVACSLDWSVTLWHVKHARPLAEIDCADAVYDVQWSPVQPGVFAAVDGTGSLSIWSVRKSLEEPLLKAQISEHALCHVAWQASGKRIAVGDSTGVVSMYDVPIDIGVVSADAFAEFDQAIKTLMLLHH